MSDGYGDGEIFKQDWSGRVKYEIEFDSREDKRRRAKEPKRLKEIGRLWEW